MITSISRIASLVVLLATSTSFVHGFGPSPSPYSTATSSSSRTGVSATALRMSTVVEPPTKEDIFREVRRRSKGKTGRRDDDSSGDFLGDAEENKRDAMRKQGPLEWLEDDPLADRDMEDPFHILVLDQTFEKPKITVEYVAQNLEYVLDMPNGDATDHAKWCMENGMTCVGVWPREECLKLGRQLQLRDIVVRVVPYAKGGDRAWQAEDAEEDLTSFAIDGVDVLE